MRRCMLLFLGALSVLAVGAQAGPTSVEQRVKRARGYEKQGAEFVVKAIKAQKKIRLSPTARAGLYRANLKRAATALRRARALVRGRKDALSATASKEITKALIDVLNNSARAYVDIGSLTRASRLVKEVLKLNPKNADALKTKREIAELKRRVTTGDGISGRWSISRPWRRPNPRPPSVPSRGGGGGR